MTHLCRSRRFLAGAVAVLALGAGCSPTRDGATGSTGGHLDVRWIGADTGSFGQPAVGRWCDSLKALTIVALQGDTGVGVAVRSARPLGQRYSVGVPPDRWPTDSAPPAAASVALRWLGKTRVEGYRAFRGELILTRSAGPLDGRFRVSLRSVYDSAKVLELAGRFSAVPLVRGAAGCSAGLD